MKDPEYTLAYFPPDPDTIKLFAQQCPWATFFVRLKDIGYVETKIISVQKAAPPKPFHDTVLALGDLELSDGGQLTLNYEIIAVPQTLEDDFSDILEGRGKVFKELRKVIDVVLSVFISDLHKEATTMLQDTPA